MSWGQDSSHSDEFFMKQTLLFSDNLKDLKSLRKQLYSAAEYFEMAYTKQVQKQIVEETLKDYAIKALVNTVDHLGSVAFKINSFLDEKMIEYSGLELRLCCVEQRAKTCQDFVNLGGLSQQSMVLEAPKHHKHYIFPGKLILHILETLNDVANTRLKSHNTSMFAPLDLQRFKNIGIQAKPKYTHSECIGDGLLMLRSPRPVPRQRPQLLSSVSMKQTLVDNRSTSPRRFPLSRTASPLSRSISPIIPIRRYPSEPRRTVSMSTVGERDVEQYSTKSKRLFKTMLSLRKSKKDPLALYNFLDDN
ncbi:protein ABIL2-like [Hibiscus syriacus]|uniref:protein ABIL2-like n=1 Tax=Hibiscus syriacus TaxID=106335 RepID=UPI0019249712|nr:protein ABIL2-like [Hibiscus syriacus]